MSDEIKKKVQARIEAENRDESAAPEPKPELTDWDIIRCARENVAGDAAVYIARNQGRFIYIVDWKYGLQFVGHSWQKDIDDNRAIAAVGRVADEYRRVYGELRKLDQGHESTLAGKSVSKKSTGSYADELKALSRKISNLRGPSRKNVVDYARTCDDSRLLIKSEALNAHPWLLACATGVIELKTGAHRPGRPDDYLTCAVTTEWKSLDEPCPIFERFLHETLGGNQDLIAYMHRMLGHTLIGRQREHVFLVLAGAKGRNGKDTLMNILLHVLGGAIMTPVPSEMLLDQGFVKNSSGPSPDTMALRFRRIAYASETDEGKRFSTSKVKLLSGGSNLTARTTYEGEMSTWNASHSLILLTNHLPHAKADDQAFWSRLHLVNFRYSFLSKPDPDNPYEKQADPDILEKMKDEASGILAWLVRGCLEYQRQGLNPPEEVTNAGKLYRDSEDVVGRFIVECCEVNEAEEIQAANLYDGFRFWYAREISKKSTFPQNKFGEILAEKGYRKVKRNVHFWQGLTFTEDFNQEITSADESRRKK
ncbi:phage/plasmid primase, P4 family [Deltaproteobacteria bacterium OttesenSCG-928-M10]|nr:phage/plasmid primase, P4 family [Deltaproteobacteria bacterium OttesenSCG-928-M10]